MSGATAISSGEPTTRDGVAVGRSEERCRSGTPLLSGATRRRAGVVRVTSEIVIVDGDGNEEPYDPNKL
ncbi:hypothetical protein [Streptomyces malaysiensis]|uniref:hypothetical protein n=1 Tax=Streptomyces malaysiensis TaxID=92644 RepID=UPI00142EE29A|nr:hypothetical protein [Streptomyces malaysiensis]